jgi:hypothetical protein
MKKLFLGNRVFPLPLTVIAALALGAALNLGSCAIGAVSPAGSTVKLAYSAAARASAPVSGSSSTEARVWVYSNNIPVANPNGQAYFSGTVDSNGGTVTISALYPGDNYLFVAAAGTNNGTTFTTTAFGTSGQFSIKAGVEITVSITLAPISIKPYLGGTNVVSVASAGSTIYAASTNTLYSSSSQTPFDPSTPAWTNLTINNLNATADGNTLLVSTSNGVYFDSNGFSSTIGPSSVNVLQAAGANHSGPFFYQADKEFGGSLDGGNNWTQISLNLPVAGKPILDMLVLTTGNPSYALVASRVVGAFMMSSDFFNGSVHDPIKEIFSGTSPYLTFFGSNLPTIQAFGKAPNGVYVGTKNGAYQINLDYNNLSGSLKTAVPALIPGTKGLDITKVLVDDNTGNAIFLASSELVLFYNATKTIYKMPFLTGTVGTLHDVACDGTNIYVAGSSGLASFPIP